MLTATPPGRPTVVDVQRLCFQARAHRETSRGFRLACWETDEGVAPPAPVQRAVPEPRPRVTVPCTAAGRKRALWDFRHRKMRRPRRSSTAGGWWERRDNSWALANFLRKSKPASSFLSMTAPLALKCQHKKRPACSVWTSARLCLLPTEILMKPTSATQEASKRPWGCPFVRSVLGSLLGSTGNYRLCRNIRHKVYHTNLRLDSRTITALINGLNKMRTVWAARACSDLDTIRVLGARDGSVHQ